MGRRQTGWRAVSRVHWGLPFTLGRGVLSIIKGWFQYSVSNRFINLFKFCNARDLGLQAFKASKLRLIHYVGWYMSEQPFFFFLDLMLRTGVRALPRLNMCTLPLRYLLQDMAGIPCPLSWTLQPRRWATNVWMSRTRILIYTIDTKTILYLNGGKIKEKLGWLQSSYLSKAHHSVLRALSVRRGSYQYFPQMGSDL